MDAAIDWLPQTGVTWAVIWFLVGLWVGVGWMALVRWWSETRNLEPPILVNPESSMPEARGDDLEPINIDPHQTPISPTGARVGTDSYRKEMIKTISEGGDPWW